MPGIQIQKASGDVQDFSREKLTRFLDRIRVPVDAVNTIVSTVEAELEDYTSTAKLRQLVSNHLQQLPEGRVLTARYNLKPALRRLGPAGHLFESYVGELLAAEGYTDIHHSVMVEGECVMHEIDLVAQKNGDFKMVECKFHNQEGTKSDITVALYSYARFLDVKDQNSLNHKISQCGIATNTKLSQDAVNYCACKNMFVISMEYPFGSSILDRVVTGNLFPLASAPIDDQDLAKMHATEMIMLSDLTHITAEKIAAETGVSIDTANKAKAFAHGVLGV